MVHSLSRTEIVALVSYLFWALCGITTVLNPINSSISQNQAYPDLAQPLIAWALRWGDAIMITLAAINAHLLAIRHWGIHQARRWILIVCLLSGAIETLGALTGFPFGHYAYTDVLGPKLFNTLPLIIPLAWSAILTSCLFITRSLFPYATALIHAASAATLATGFDWILEPYAVHIKGYWRWMDSDGEASAHIPVQNYFSWWSLSFLLILIFAPREFKKSPDPRPWMILGTMVLLFLLARSLHT
jgi:putative membrane protein